MRHPLVGVQSFLCERLSADVRAISWVKPESLHVTMKFLGEVAESQIKHVRDALASFPPFAPVELKAAKLEWLPPRGPLRIIAAGLSGDLERLSQLHQEIEIRCVPLGFPAESRKFLPHITLARVKQRLRATPRDIQQWAQPLLPTPSMSVKEFVLMESD